MTITREQVADLQPGDVVRIWVEGPLERNDEGCLRLSTTQTLSWESGRVASWCEPLTLTVVSRAPRPLYVNHPRTEPVDGDIARDRDGDAWRRSINRWFMAGGSAGVDSIDDCKPLTLLWDGQRKQVVP